MTQAFDPYLPRTELKASGTAQLYGCCFHGGVVSQESTHTHTHTRRRKNTETPTFVIQELGVGVCVDEMIAEDRVKVFSPVTSFSQP